VELRLELENRASAYEPVRDQLIAHLRAAGVAEDTIGEIELILEEVLVNLISYAYDAEGAGRIEVSAAVQDDAVTFVFRDRGSPFDPLARDEPNLDEPIATRQIGGLGIFLVTELATNVTYERVGDENVLTVVKAR
jgi:anti-sigma regulatory factor (Ser/Thr protein kinase)